MSTKSGCFVHDFMMKQGIKSPEEWLLSGRRFTTPSKLLLRGSPIKKFTAPSICQSASCPLPDDLVAPIRPIPTPSHPFDSEG